MDSKVFIFFVLGFVFSQGAQVEVTPREVLVLPGQNVTVMCRVGVPLQYCRVEIPNMKPLNLNSKLSNPDVAYYGSGLTAGQCGFTINRVTEKNNGIVRCTLGIETEATESMGTVQLIVAKAPKIPEMDLSRGADSVNIYKLNDILQASCVVREGRPVANISWFLNEEPIYSNDLSMATVVDMAKENLQSKVQNMTRMLQASDNGKFLRCVAYHPAYPEGKAETSRQLDVKYSPLPQADIHKFGYIVGQAGLITIVVEANPRPIIEWDVGGERIKENQNDQTGRMEAEEVKDMGNGRYDVSLRIAAIRKEDTEKTYTLRAYNDMGSYDYNVIISTSPEPEGIELGIGGIIGIVVSILIVLFIVFLLIFAKVTGRWCFSDGATVIDYTTGDSTHHVTNDGIDNPHHQNSQEYINEQQDVRNLGESSDTESADVRNKDPKHFPIKLTQFFKKNKDKVASTDEIEPKILDDDTKKPLEGTTSDEPKDSALVYAELDLVSPSVGPVVKNDNEKTEYAEIVYPENKS